MNSEWIGLIGGLAGTVLGWGLNVLTQKGKLHIYPEWHDEFLQNDAVGGTKKCSKLDQADFYTYNLKIDVYNSSADAKIMRDIKIVFYKGQNELFRLIPKDDSTTEHRYGMVKADDISPVTIPAKSIVRKELRGGLYKSDKHFSQLCQINRIMLSYCKKGSREKHILIKDK